MKLYVSYGFYIALAGAILTLAIFALGYHTENIGVGEKLGYLGIIIAIVGLALGMRAWRDTVGKGKMSYGRGLGTGVLISLWSGLFTAIFNLIYFMVINPGFAETMTQYKISEMEAKGMPQQAIQSAEGIMRFMMKPPVMTISGFIGGVIFSFVICLILAAIFKSDGGKNSGSVPPVQA